MTDTKKSCTLHEHLHNELKQLIAVDPPNNDDDKGALISASITCIYYKNTSNHCPSVSQNGKNTAGLDPKSILKLSKNDERRQNKVRVVTRLLDTLREDQTGIPTNNPSGDVGLKGRIHGCVGSHWELLPPVYADSCHEVVNAKPDNSEMIEDFISKESDSSTPDIKKSELASSWLLTGSKDEKQPEEENNKSAADESSSPKERVYPLIRGGGLRLPGLDWNKTFRKGYTVLVWVRPTLNCVQTSIPEAAAIRKQVLYRFATSLHDNVVGSVGVCAILGQWQAVSCENSNGDGSRTLLTTTVTAYTLPNSDPMSHLYPTEKSAKQPTEPEYNIGDSKEKSAHERNMEHFKQRKHDHQAASSNKGRLLKHKKSSKHLGSQKSKDSAAPSSSIGEYVTTHLTLPADEWSLIGIQHTHPYLRRPELMISVNGEETSKGELAYPVLDAVDSSTDDEITGGVSAVTISDSSSPNPEAQNCDGALGASASFLSDAERKMLKRRGVLAECTLLDGAFENGVLVDTQAKSRGRNDHEEKLNCVVSVHSLALLSGTVPNAVLAIVAERGPLGDSSSGSGLSFLLGPVPTNPQNRDSIVAILAGYGYYGSGGGSSSISGSGHTQDKFATPARSIGLPMSIGISPGVTLRKGAKSSHDNSAHGNDSLHFSDTWIGSEKEIDAHVLLQGLIGRAILTFHAGDTRLLGQTATDHITTSKGRIVCQPSAAPACIGGADEVPKVGIVRPTTPAPHSPSATLEVTGNAHYNNVTLTYIHKENIRKRIQMKSSADNSSKYEDQPPVSFTRAIHASNAVNCALLPFRLALPKAGCEEVNHAQQTLHAESFIHLSDLLSSEAELAGLLIELLNECILSSGSTIRDESLQSGTLHSLTNLLRRLLIRGTRLGLLAKDGKLNRLTEKSSSGENIDYDQDHDSSCTPAMPTVVCKALTHLVDVCCGPVSINTDSLTVPDPHRGLLRIRRTSDLALTTFFGLALDFDFLGNDVTASASILASISDRYCQISTTLLNSKGPPHEEPLYGSLLRSQMNIQYFLDSIRVRFDNSVSPASKQAKRYSVQEQDALYSIADSLSDILYSMLLSSLTSASGSAVTRGERDIGALVATLTECSFGTVCASVVANAIAKLLIKCGVFSPQCLEKSPHKLKPSHRRPDTVDLALENRLARNMLLCRYHDIVGPMLLSKSAPNYAVATSQSKDDTEVNKSDTQTLVSCTVGVVSNTGRFLDWTSDWRLSLLTFSVSSCYCSSYDYSHLFANKILLFFLTASG